MTAGKIHNLHYVCDVSVCADPKYEACLIFPQADNAKNDATSLGKNVAGKATAAGKNMANNVKAVGMDAVNKAKEAGMAAVDKAKATGMDAVKKAKEAGMGALNKAKSLGMGAFGKAKAQQFLIVRPKIKSCGKSPMKKPSKVVSTIRSMSL